MMDTALCDIADISGDNTMRVWPGNAYPLGATWDGKGVNFALFSEHATKVELCLFDAVEADKETHRFV
jgi:glycogen operon protein